MQKKITPAIARNILQHNETSQADEYAKQMLAGAWAQDERDFLTPKYPKYIRLKTSDTQAIIVMQGRYFLAVGACNIVEKRAYILQLYEQSIDYALLKKSFAGYTVGIVEFLNLENI